MGHYDNCRPENCSKCGQSKGHCEHTQMFHLPIKGTNEILSVTYHVIEQLKKLIKK